MKGIKTKISILGNQCLIGLGIVFAVSSLAFFIDMWLTEIYLSPFLLLQLFLIASIPITIGIINNLSQIEVNEEYIKLIYPVLGKGTPKHGKNYCIKFSLIENVFVQEECITIKTILGIYTIKHLQNAHDLSIYIENKIIKNNELNINDNNPELLQKLYELYQASVITKEEYEKKKEEILSRI